jgi:uncharacterized damage-inducible protein DinB
MSIAENLIQEFIHESGTTRKLFERLPENLSWQPHAKSMSLGRLATHVAEIPQWAGRIALQDRLEMIPGKYTPVTLGSPAEILGVFETNVSGFTEALKGQGDEALMKIWTFLFDGRVVVELPKVVALRSFVLSHLIHHRGQLSVYLRMNDVPLPGIYGPTADEPI